jgi:hypothetical protein
MTLDIKDMHLSDGGLREVRISAQEDGTFLMTVNKIKLSRAAP